MIEQLKAFDSTLFLLLNGSDSAYWDGVMWLVTKTATWVPLLLVLVHVLLKNVGFRRSLFIILALAITIALADQLSSSVIKPLVMRWRPTRDPMFLHTIDTVFGYRGGRFGFVSSHGANTFAVFVFLSLLFRSRLLTASLFLWACVSSYSRIYLGVHYFGDVFCGALLGALIGLSVNAIYSRLNAATDGERQYFSSAYTSSGFLHSDMHLLCFVLLLTYLVVLLAAIFLVSF